MGRWRWEVLGFHPHFQIGVLLLQGRIRERQVLELFLLQPFGPGELGGLGLDRFDAGGEGVEDVGFLVGARHGWGFV